MLELIITLCAKEIPVPSCHTQNCSGQFTLKAKICLNHQIYAWVETRVSKQSLQPSIGSKFLWRQEQVWHVRHSRRHTKGTLHSKTLPSSALPGVSFMARRCSSLIDHHTQLAGLASLDGDYLHTTQRMLTQCYKCCLQAWPQTSMLAT